MPTTSWRRTPTSRGSARAMQDALDSAHLNPDQVDLINCHAASTPLGDLAESKAISHRVQGPAPRECRSHSTKSMTGHPARRGKRRGGHCRHPGHSSGASSIRRSTSSSRTRGSQLNVVRNQPREAGSITSSPTVSGSADRTRPSHSPGSRADRERLRGSRPSTESRLRRWRRRQPCRRRSTWPIMVAKIPVVLQLLRQQRRPRVRAGPAPGSRPRRSAWPAPSEVGLRDGTAVLRLFRK